ncbi:hypothetical protein CONPUDRAFT_71618 [Coniophora puteana RWD-64-598 SS2]|uniref:Uncharacterized protein n=1 Tax=Coniophora puteana (strain RWD-64-598) TaxID=741705 RepID=A0A5M3MV89_CONPW|nr:uncharacterized protein CONPUDRAFT_71618 [Coniophora puteana RWD-64-598 SS2]EIW82960.1 hypothetical protein CONPUDRAFT_71618 [Coniophora puteana RWD-64-598 SS2]
MSPMPVNNTFIKRTDAMPHVAGTYKMSHPPASSHQFTISARFLSTLPWSSRMTTAKISQSQGHSQPAKPPKQLLACPKQIFWPTSTEIVQSHGESKTEDPASNNKGCSLAQEELDKRWEAFQVKEYHSKGVVGSWASRQLEKIEHFGEVFLSIVYELYHMFLATENKQLVQLESSVVQNKVAVE